MNLFNSVKLATFAEKLFANAGLNLQELVTKADENALKAHIDAQVSAARAENPDAQLIEALQASVDEAAQVNATLEAKVKEIEPAAAAMASFTTTLASAGITFDKPEALADALEARISARARELLAATGSTPVAESPATDSARPASAARQEMTHAEFSALTPGAKMRFCKSGGRVTDLPIK